MTDNEYLAYIAGIVDGEGCIGLVNCNTTFRTVRVSITQKGQRAFLEKVKARWGGGIYRRSSGVDQWMIQAVANVDKFLGDILPWLDFKRSKAIIALALCQAHPGSGNYLSEKDQLARILLEQKFEEVKVAGRVV